VATGNDVTAEVVAPLALVVKLANDPPADVHKLGTPDEPVTVSGLFGLKPDNGPTYTETPAVLPAGAYGIPEGVPATGR